MLLSCGFWNMDSSEYEMKGDIDDAEGFGEPPFVSTESETDFGGNSEDPVLEENFEAIEKTEDVVSGECTIKKNVDDARILMEPLVESIIVEPDFERSGETIVEENSEANKIMQNVYSSECVIKRETDGEEALMEPVFVPIKSEPVFEETSEETVMEENFEVAENTVDMDCDKSEAKEAEALFAPLFVPIKAEPDFERTSEETILAENNEVSSDTNQGPHVYFSTVPSGSQIAASSTLASLVEESEMVNNQKYISENTCSSGRATVLVEKSQCQKSFAVASSSAAHSMTSQEETADENQLDGTREGQEEGESWKKQTDVSEDVSYQGIQLQREMLVSSQMTTCMKSERKVKKRTYECSTCKKGFVRKGYLLTHMRIHTGERPFLCNQCGKSFTHGHSLTVHMRTHSGDLPYKCIQCGECFAHNASLTAHMKTHSEEKPFKCLQCEKAFRERTNLSVHMRTHNGDRPYKCSHCEKSFTHSSYLTVHIRTHTGERPYQCPQCEKSFSNQRALTQHERTHSGERPYLCTTCGERFKCSSNLSNHKRRLHAAASSAS